MSMDGRHWVRGRERSSTTTAPPTLPPCTNLALLLRHRQLQLFELRRLAPEPRHLLVELARLARVGLLGRHQRLLALLGLALERGHPLAQPARALASVNRLTTLLRHLARELLQMLLLQEVIARERLRILLVARDLE